MSALKERIKEIFQEKETQYKADVENGKIKPLVPTEDYINEDGVRIRTYKKKNYENIY